MIEIDKNLLHIIIGLSAGVIGCCGCVLIVCCAGICYYYRQKPTIIKEFHIENLPQNPSISAQRVQSRSRISLANQVSTDNFSINHSDNDEVIGINDRASPSSNSIDGYDDHLQHTTINTITATNNTRNTTVQVLTDTEKHHKKKSKKHRKKSSKSSKSHHRKKSKSKKHGKNKHESKSVMSSPSNHTMNIHHTMDINHIQNTNQLQRLSLNRAEGGSTNPSETKEDDDDDDDDDDLYDNMGTNTTPNRDNRVEQFAKLQRRVTAGADLNDNEIVNDNVNNDDDLLQKEENKNKNKQRGHRKFDSEDMYVQVRSTKLSDASETPFGDTMSGGNNNNDNGQTMFHSITKQPFEAPILRDIHDEKKLNNNLIKQELKDDQDDDDDDDDNEREHSHSASTLTVKTINTNHTMVTADGNETGSSRNRTPKGIRLMTPTTTATNTTNTTNTTDVMNDNDMASPISVESIQNNIIQTMSQHLSQRTMSGPEGGVILPKGNGNLELYDDELALEETDKRRKHSMVNALYPSHIKQEQFLNDNGLSPISNEMDQKIDIIVHNDMNINNNMDNYEESVYTMDGHRRNTMLTQITSRSEGDKTSKEEQKMAEAQQLSRKMMNQYEINQRNIPDLNEESTLIDYQVEDDMKSIHHDTIKKHINDKKHKKKKSKRDKKDKKDKKEKKNKKDKKEKKDKKHRKKSKKEKKKDKKKHKDDINQNNENENNNNNNDNIKKEDEIQQQQQQQSSANDTSDDEDVLVGLNTNITPAGPPPINNNTHQHHLSRIQPFSSVLIGKAKSYDQVHKIQNQQQQQLQQQQQHKHSPQIQASSPFALSGPAQYHTQPNLKYVPKSPQQQYGMMMNASSPPNFIPSPPQNATSSFVLNPSSNDNQENDVKPPPRFVRPNKR